MKQLIVSILSDQTIPNILLIKEYGSPDTDYLFVTTKQMIEKQIIQRIETVCSIKGMKPVIVADNTIVELSTQMKDFDINRYQTILVNLTGGTKMMNLSVYNHFSHYQQAKMLYLPIGKNMIVDLDSQSVTEIKYRMTIREYMLAYGVECDFETPSGISGETTNKIYDHFVSIDLSEYVPAFSQLREKRSKLKEGRSFAYCDGDEVDSFIKALGYSKEKKHLTKEEIKYLTGGWFEQWVWQKIKGQLQLDNNYCVCGVLLKSKGNTPHTKNDIIAITGCEPATDTSNNELDVVFIYNNVLYTIECKTSIFDIREDGKEKSILGETIYKSDSLQQLFGLYPKTNIMTLTDFKSVCQNKGKRGKLIDDLNRANISKIKVIDLRQIENNKSNLFNIIK